jgi:hypothetical protein
MLEAAVLAFLWAQVEPAPAETTPPPGAPVVATPPPAPPPSPFDKRIAVYVGISRRLGPEGTSVGPTDGPSFGGSFARRYFTSPGGFDLYVGVDFFYEQFQSDLLGTTLSQTSFAIVQTAGWRFRRLHPFAQVGAGVTIGYASVSSGTLDSQQPLVRGAAGLDIAITPAIGVSLRFAYSLLFTRPILTTQATPTVSSTSYSLFGDLFDADLGVVLLF